MKQIPSDIVEKTWKKMGGMSPADAPKMISRLTKQQSWILAYLMAAGDDSLNRDERELLFYLGIVIWRIMSQGDKCLSEVTDKIIDEAEEANIKMLEYLEDESPDDFADVIEKVLENYNQYYVLQYIVEALMEEDSEEECLIRDENIGMMMIYLKTVIDCFDRD